MRSLVFGFFFLSVSLYANSPLTIITSLFPLYDFSRTIGGSDAEVTLLIPPGIDPHAFEPTPRDMVTFNRADVVIYTSPVMEPWIHKLVNNSQQFVAATDLEEGSTCGGHGHDHSSHDDITTDPHVWLNPLEAQKMVAVICSAMVKARPEHTFQFESRADSLLVQLQELDTELEMMFQQCEQRTFYLASHMAFGHFSARYNLTTVSVIKNFSSDAEPSAKRLAEIITAVRKTEATAIYYSALTEPRIARTISRETGVAMIPLHSAHNLSRDDMAKGRTYLDIMRANGENLMKGLICIQ